MPQAAASTTRENNFFHAERKNFKYKTLGWAGAGAHNRKGRSVELVIPPVVKWHLQERWNQHIYTSLTLLPFGLWAPGRGQQNTCLIETKNLGMSRPNSMPGINNPVNCSGKKNKKLCPATSTQTIYESIHESESTTGITLYVPA